MFIFFKGLEGDLFIFFISTFYADDYVNEFYKANPLIWVNQKELHPYFYGRTLSINLER